MPRLRDRITGRPFDPGHGRHLLALQMGPTTGEGITVEQLAVSWAVRRDEMMREKHSPGWRPWAFWWFELGEVPPRRDGRPMEWEAIRLAELGELRDDELGALQERANEAKARIGTGSERVSGGSLEHGGCAVVSMDRQAVELYEAVCAARGGA